ncbi:MAG: GNAT family N-acetyltransferase [bacterium]
MLHEINASDFPQVGQLFAGHEQHLPVTAIIEGNYPGRVFVDNDRQPTAALVWALGRWAYLDGQDRLPGLEASLEQLVRDVIIPGSGDIGQNWFELYTPYKQHWMRVLKTALAGWGPERHFEVVFTWSPEKYCHFRTNYALPADVTIAMVDLPLVPARVSSAKSVDDSWGARTSVGAQVMLADRIISQCRSNGFESAGKFMIDIETFDPSDRHKGYATAAAVTLLDYCLDKKLNPLWETTAANGISQRMAHKLGFDKHESYPVYAIEF